MKRIIFFISFLLITTSVFTQIVIEKSTDVVVVLGRKYYIHTVKEGETIFGLSKTYEVPADQILSINKEVVVSLQANTALRIPVIDENFENVPITKITFTEHKVEKNESLYAIAMQYKTSQDEIIKYNPQIENGITKGMVLKIPIIEQGEFKAKDEFFIYHQVKNGENINTISQFYNVQISEIAEFNDINNIISGQILAIPTKTLSQEQIFIIKNNKPLLPDFINIDPNYFEDPKYPPCSKFVYNDTMTFKIAIVLPFYATQNYSYSLNAASSKSGISFYKNTQVFFNFLQGVLLAVDKLKSEGYNLKIFVYDTQGDSTILNSIFNRYEMTKMDLIIGPAYSSNYSIVEDFCSKNKINIVSPLTTHNTVIDSNGFVFKIMPGYEQLTLFAAQHFTQYADTSLIAVINNETPKQQSLADSLHQSLLMLADNPTNLNFKKINFSKFVTPYQNNLDKQKFNIVFITSTDEVEVSAILNNLNSLVVVSKYKIRVYCLPSVANFTKLQIEWLSNLNLHFISSTYINPESVDIKEFENKYTKMFGAKSTMYSHIGYDVMYYFVTALKMYGKYFQFCINQNQEFMSKGTFMNFEFYRHNKTGGFENHGLFMLFYDKDLNIKLETNPELKYIDMIK